MIRLSGSVKLSCASSGGTPKSRANGFVPSTLARIVRRPTLLPILRRLPRFEPRFRRRDFREPLLAPLQFGRELIAPDVRPQRRILRRVAGVGLRRERGDLLTQPPLFVSHPSVTHRLVLARIGLHLRPSTASAPSCTTPASRAICHHLHEQRLERGQVLLPKLRDRSVRRKVARRQHAIGDILFQLPRDPTRRKRSSRIRVHQTVTIICGSNG